MLCHVKYTGILDASQILTSYYFYLIKKFTICLNCNDFEIIGRYLILKKSKTLDVFSLLKKNSSSSQGLAYGLIFLDRCIILLYTKEPPNQTKLLSLSYDNVDG